MQLVNTMFLQNMHPSPQSDVDVQSLTLSFLKIHRILDSQLERAGCSTFWPLNRDALLRLSVTIPTGERQGEQKQGTTWMRELLLLCI